MMERFDELVTDPRLRRDELLAHVETLTGDALLLGRYRVMTTSGSSGRKGLFVYDRPAWRALIAQFLRYNAMAGVRPRLPRRLRVAALGAASPSHMSRRVAQTADVGLHRVLSLPVTLPLTRLVEQLNRFQPQFVNAYPSVAVLLAEEQLAGRLRIAPERMSTSSELRTPEMTARIEEAFGVRPFDLYAHHRRPVGRRVRAAHGHPPVRGHDDRRERRRGRPPRAPRRARSAAARHQPREPHPAADPPRGRRRGDARPASPCPCGRTLIRVRAIDGRSDDVLELPGAGAATVSVHPLQFAVVARDRDVVEFQVVQDGPRLRLLVVARGEAPALETRLRTAVEQRLRDVGVAEPDVEVERRSRARAPAGGKLQIVVADRTGRYTSEPAHEAHR